MPPLSTLDKTRIALENVADIASDMAVPTLKLGVTGLSRAGKTVFITALVHGLTAAGRFPLFEAHESGRIRRASLQHQPDDGVPRFAYEKHLSDLVERREWPASTRLISQLRVTIEYESASWLSRTFSSGKLHLDITDYPGEWLLDLGLMSKSFEDWSDEAFAIAGHGPRAKISGAWLKATEEADPDAGENEQQAEALSNAFKAYLKACRDDDYALTALPPGRFLMPGDLEGSPALTFSPLPAEKFRRAERHSFWQMMERRFEAYKDRVVRPFFRDHFARLDRQIVLVDPLPALNAGPTALFDLERAISDALSAFRPGRNSWLTSLFAPRISKVLFAAAKADHLHHESHDRLEALMTHLVRRAAKSADAAGADIDTVALASIRATREAWHTANGGELPMIRGVPRKGEVLGKESFDGEREAAVFPGDLPNDVTSLFDRSGTAERPDFRFIRFRPPQPFAPEGGGFEDWAFPHIRLDRALEFLLGDRLS